MSARRDRTDTPVTLPGGRELTIRAARPDDLEAFAELFDGLSSEDRTNRFFNVFRPPRSLLAGWLDAEAAGGYRLVAVVTDPALGEGGSAEGAERIVGEAGYSKLENGNGELSLTVAEEWRGWLGPYLLDALFEAAATREVPNLEAEVLVHNQAMLSVMRARGYATIGHPDGATVRIVAGTRTNMPTWAPADRRPRLLVESGGGRWRAEDQAAASGLSVMICSGPTRGPRGRCPALEVRHCPLAAAADVVACSLGPGRRGEEISSAHMRLHQGAVIWAPDPSASPEELAREAVQLCATGGG